ncbi:hypothetical protein BX666DRAFT_1880846 [Dichotomocladium elegans]|nr:hypothetical protein BX666DRAFT_1880846 [Dichotomocladium elegans]
MNSVDSGSQQQNLSNTAIALICTCCVLGIALVIGFMFLLRRFRQRPPPGFVTFEDAAAATASTSSLPPPETHDLVFNSILAHPPKPPPTASTGAYLSSSSSSPSSAAAGRQQYNQMDMFEEGYSYSELGLGPRGGNEKDLMEIHDPKVLQSLARQWDSWAGYHHHHHHHRPNTHQNQHRISSNSTYQVW